MPLLKKYDILFYNMTNKKTIILGLIALVILSGIIWYGAKNKQQIADQAASILATGGEEEVIESAAVGEFFLGNPEAPVTIISYASHFCGHCVNFHLQTLPLITEKYIKTGKVKFVPRLLSPMELDTAVLCANEQGNFQAFNDYLFEYGQELKSVDDLKAIAGNLGLNQGEFDQCYDSEKYKNKVEQWFQQAQEDGISGTPTLFINGQEIAGNQPYSVFEEAIERALAQ